MKTQITFLGRLVAALVATACSDPNGNDPGGLAQGTGDPGSLLIHAQRDTIGIDDSTWFYWDGGPDSIVDRWTISDTTVVRVFRQHRASLGVVALDTGTVILTAWKGAEWGKASLVVLTSYHPDTAVARVFIGGCAFRAAVGDSIDIGFNAFDAKGNALFGRPRTYSLSDSSIAQIFRWNETSVWLRALKRGSTTLTITVEGKTACRQIVIGDSVPPVYSLCGETLNPVETVTVRLANDSVTAQQYPAFDSELKDAHGYALDCRIIDWSVSDTTILRLQEAYGWNGRSIWGIVQRAGTVTVTATSEGKSGTITIP